MEVLPYMKKKFYKVSGLLLSSFIGLMGFNSCKTVQNKPESKGLATEDSVVREQGEVKPMYGVPTPTPVPREKLNDKELRVVYGPPPGYNERRRMPVSPDETKVYDVVEQMPAFPGGLEGMAEWIKSNLKYPDEAMRDSIQGRVVVTFIVERDGSVSGAEVARSVHPLLDAEALRLIGQMPKWAPGQMGGVAVRVKYTIPVSFTLK